MSDCPLVGQPCSEISILLVDDDDCLRSAVAWSLREDGHEVLEYRAPDQVPPFSALQAVRVVITDYDMPRTDGVTFADAVHQALPDVPVLLLTGHAPPWVLEAVEAREFLSLSIKPLDYEALHGAIHSARTSSRSSLCNVGA